jgi:hypothetical protein
VNEPPPIPGATYVLAPGGAAPPGYPCAPVPNAYAESPFTASFAGRRAAFLDHVARNPAPAHLSGVFHEVARLMAGGVPHAGVIAAALAHIEARRDCADFVLHAILRLLLQFPDDPRVPASLWARMRAAVLGFKYWPDEPGRDSLCTWTENHQILFASAAWLAGSIFPDTRFENDGRTGREKRERFLPRIRRWLELRFRTGFSEWLSHVYYDEDMVALLSIVDFAGDEELARRAAMVLDLLLLELALHSHRGVFGSTHGRSYERCKKWARQESTTDLAKLVYGTGSFASVECMAAACLALSPSYRVPAALEAVARESASARGSVRQRMGIRIEEAERFGFDLRELEDGMALLAMEAYTHPRTFALFVDLLDAYHWWENEFFRPFWRGRKLLRRLRGLGLLPWLARALEWDLTRNLRPEVDVVTYRDPDFMLSSAPDWRPGFGGDQQHLWQATLGPDAVCFTTHPGPQAARSPGWWTGSATLPRVAQSENVAIVLYRIRRLPALYVPNRNFFTHAWLPRDRFDEVRESRGWVFARRGDGYLALRSQRPARWSSEPGEDRGRALQADGAENVWVCELGSRARNGSFGQFCERVAGARIEDGRLSIAYESPSQGRLEFGWTGPLRRNGRPVPQHGFPRYESPWVQAAYPSDEIEVRAGAETLTLRWRGAERRASRFLLPEPDRSAPASDRPSR